MKASWKDWRKSIRSKAPDFRRFDLLSRKVVWSCCFLILGRDSATEFGS
jgi:hypothetical protein